MRHCCRWHGRSIGVLINEIPTEELESLTLVYARFERQGIPCWGCRKVTYCGCVRVEELVTSSKQVLCRRDRLDLMVESLAVGAMNVNAALKYFRLRHNGSGDGGDRVEIQLAALESSTQC